jgi:hypothetical protein
MSGLRDGEGKKQGGRIGDGAGMYSVVCKSSTADGRPRANHMSGRTARVQASSMFLAAAGREQPVAQHTA